VKKELEVLMKVLPEVVISIASNGSKVSFDFIVKGHKRKNKTNSEDLTAFLVSRLPEKIASSSLLKYYGSTKIYVSKDIMAEIKNKLEMVE